MLTKFGHMSEVREATLDIPKDAYNSLVECVQVLDNEYGANRNVDEDDGGYVVLLKVEGDIAELRTFFPVDTCLPEWVNLSRSGYTTTLYMMNNDYSVVLIMPESLARTIPNIKDELDREEEL